MNDRAYDSGVFLEAHSFHSYGIASSSSSSTMVRDYNTITPDKGKSRTINLDIHFASDSYEIPAEYFPEMDKLAAYLKNHDDIRLQIIGHTDSTGSKEHNQQLSERRAKEMLNYLIKKGIAKERLSSKGIADSKPASSNTTESGRAVNRRVELVFKRD
jgi:outer membrane protein OmpA-like peptidoglycan-associated protein